MKDQHDKRTGNLLATPNAIRQARFAEQPVQLGQAVSLWWQPQQAHALAA